MPTPRHRLRRPSGIVPRLLLVVALLLAVGTPVSLSDSPASAAPALGSDAGPVRVIVELDVEPRRHAGGIGGSSAAEDRRSVIAARAAEVTDDLDRLGAGVTTTFATRPYLAVSVEPDDVASVLRTPGVVSVVPDEVVTVALDESLPPVGAAAPAAPYVGRDMGGQGWSVAVIDTGVDRDHGFFGGDAASRVVAEACYSVESDCPNGGTQDTGEGSAAPLQGDPHGTHVAGIAAGSGDGGGPAQGVAPLADIVAVQAFSVLDDGRRASYVSDLAKGLEFVLAQHTADNGVLVSAVNLSLGSGAQDTCNSTGAWDVFSGFVDDLRAEQVLTVAAAGNGSHRQAMGAPACLDNVVSVGATGNDGVLAGFSDLDHATDLVAPGVGITSAVPGGGYAAKSGTSMSTPHVAGALALLRQAAPQTPISQLLPALRSSQTLVDDDRADGVVQDIPFLDVPKALTVLPGHPDGPAAPGAPVATPGDGEVQLGWQAPATDDGITGYDAISRPGGHVCHTPASSTTCTIDGLTNGTAYTFTVIASNAAGPGPSSTASAPKIPAGLPAAPTNVLAAAGVNEATVSWDPPDDDGGAPIIEYAVATSDAALPGCSSTDPAGDPATSCLVTGLDGASEYTFTVTASNGASVSAASEPSPAITPEAVPGPPQSVTATGGQNGRSSVSWSPPDDPGTSTIAGYRVTSQPGGHTCATEGPDPALNCAVEGLTNGTIYTFAVTATNDHGTGRASEPSAAITPIGLPAAPTDIIATSGDQQVALSWTPPASDGGAPITNYRVTSDDGATKDCGDTPDCTITGLTNGALYTFTVRAENTAGFGPASAPTPESIPSTVSDAPTNVELATGDPETAVVSWTAPTSDGGASITRYTATADPGGQTCTSDARSLTCTVAGLTGGQAYTFTAHATNQRGDSLPSAASDAFTPVAATSGDTGGSGGGGAGGGGGGGGSPLPPDDEETEPAPVTESDGSLPDLEPGTSTLLLDGEPAAATTTGTNDSLTVSSTDFSLTLSPQTSTGGAKPSVTGTSMVLAAGGGMHVDFDGLQAGSGLHVWLFSDPVLLGSSPASASGDVDATVNISTGTAPGEHTVQVGGLLTDGRTFTFNLGIHVDAAVGFTDVDPQSTHGASVLRLAELGIASGFADGTFGPGELIDRGQMAAFLQRALQLDPRTSETFSDVGGTTHERAIGAIAEVDIAGGFEDGTYRPRATVTRGQMATFLANAVDLEDVADGPFTDLEGNVHAGSVNAVAARNIATGYSDSTYRPELSITRGQMATLISGMLDHRV